MLRRHLFVLYHSGGLVGEGHSVKVSRFRASGSYEPSSRNTAGSRRGHPLPYQTCSNLLLTAPTWWSPIKCRSGGSRQAGRSAAAAGRQPRFHIPGVSSRDGGTVVRFRFCNPPHLVLGSFHLLPPSGSSANTVGHI